MDGRRAITGVEKPDAPRSFPRRPAEPAFEDGRHRDYSPWFSDTQCRASVGLIHDSGVDATHAFGVDRELLCGRTRAGSVLIC